MGSTYERSFLKGMLWEGIGFLIAFLIAFTYYGNIPESIGFAVLLTLVKIPLFFIHERIWKMIKWEDREKRKKETTLFKESLNQKTKQLKTFFL